MIYKLLETLRKRKEKNGKVVPAKKTVFSLSPNSCNVKEILAMLENMWKQLRKRIYTAQNAMECSY